MDVALWIVQALLGLAFLGAGFMKLTQPKEKLVTMMTWTEDFQPNIIKGIGLLEILAAIGLIVPSITRILPVLTPLAAAGLVVIMLGAIFTHLRRNEAQVIVVNIVFLLLAAFVAYGRFVLVPLA